MISKERKAKLTWQCRRGLLELDIIFENIIDNHLDSMTEEEVNGFEKLLHHQDSFLYAWLMGVEQPEDKETKDRVQFVMSRYQAKKI